MLQISSSAVKEIKRIQQNRQQPDAPVKLKIISGGCSGLSYQLQLEDIADSDGSNAPLLEARCLEINGIRVLVDQKSWKYLKNLKIDYAEDLMGGGFRFNNPQVKDVCGCGISFAIAD
ncbi:MAG: iron-sulfur cluster assembly accessory protein [Pleurocapsa sp. MO_226.B13]|nr:iron-sulfur cluster assembly accessory protein [Pleurocapsa sp. MO_226.B13]